MTEQEFLDRCWDEQVPCIEHKCEKCPKGGTCFFPDTPMQTAVAVNICRKCPLKNECLDQSLRIRDQYGVRGGMNERQRRAMIRKMGEQRKQEVCVMCGSLFTPSRSVRTCCSRECNSKFYAARAS